MTTKKNKEVRVKSVTRRVFSENAVNANGESLKGKSYLELAASATPESTSGKTLIGGKTYKINVFKDDANTGNIYEFFWARFINDEGKSTLKVDVPTNVYELDVWISIIIETVALETPYHRKGNDGKYGTPITSVTVVVLEDQNAVAQVTRLLKQYRYEPIRTVIAEQKDDKDFQTDLVD